MIKFGKQLTRTGWNALFSPLRMLLISACCYFVSAGRLDIPRGWFYYLLALALSLCANLFFFYRAPELLNERGRMGEGTESCDKILLLLYFGTALVILPVIAGLDTGRFNRPPLPGFFIYAGVVLYAICFVVILWAMLENPFFEGTMRLQKERGHYVVSRGPYRYVRHPGYLGMAVNALPLPLIAGSRAALIPALFTIIVIVIRTTLEDKLLLDHLPGYRDYSRRVRYRLLPPIW